MKTIYTTNVKIYTTYLNIYKKLEKTNNVNKNLSNLSKSDFLMILGG